MNLLGIQKHRTCAFNPRANGMVERFHRQLKASLIAHAQKDWTISLRLVMLGIRTALKEDLGCSSAEIVPTSFSMTTHRAILVDPVILPSV